MNDYLKTESGDRYLFSKMKVRYIFLELFLILMFLSIIMAIIGAIYPPLQEIIESQEHQFYPFFSLSLISLLCIAICHRIFKKLYTKQIYIKQLVGKFPFKKKLWMPVFITIAANILLCWGMGRVNRFLNTVIFQNPIAETNSNFIYDGDNLALKVIYWGLLFTIYVIILPITIEFIFRGLILHRWATKWGIIPGILMSSCLFGLIGLNDGLLGFTSFSIWNIIQALLYIKTRSLIPPIISYALLYFISFVSLFIEANLDTITTNPEITFFYLWVGIIYIIMSIPVLIYFLEIPKNIEALPYLANDRPNS